MNLANFINCDVFPNIKSVLSVSWVASFYVTALPTTGQLIGAQETERCLRGKCGEKRRLERNSAVRLKQHNRSRLAECKRSCPD